MAANKALAAVNPAVIPTPRAITASCGMTLRFEAEDAAAATRLAVAVPEARGLAAPLRRPGGGGVRVAGKAVGGDAGVGTVITAF